MGELNDYSGDFKPDLKLQDFSKDALVRLYGAASRLYSAIDARWYSLMKEKFGDETAKELHWEMWRQHTTVDVGFTRKPMKFGNGVADVLKFLQINPGAGGFVYLETEWELKNENHGIMTVKRCAGMENFERYNDVAGQLDACGMEE